MKKTLKGSDRIFFLNNCVTIHPDDPQAYYNWGYNSGNLAKLKRGVEAEALYQGACKKYEKVVTIHPDNRQAYYNWGNDLGNLAKMKTGVEAEALYQEAFEKYGKAVSIHPDFHQAYYNWGIELAHLADLKTGKETEILYEEAFEKYKLAAEKGGGCYDLACLYAVRSCREEAFRWLKQSLEKGEITVEFVEQDTDWAAYREDAEFIALLAAARKALGPQEDGKRT